MTIIGGTNNGPKKDAKPPTGTGTNEGQVKFTKGTGGITNFGNGIKYWKWSDNSWEEIDKAEYDTKKNAATTIEVSSGQLAAAGDGTVARWPSNQKIDGTSHYVLFQFGEYIAPFAALNGKRHTSEKDAYQIYNQSTSELKAKSIKTSGGKSVNSIYLPMPQDLSVEQKGNWQGKKFTRVGAAAIAASSGNLSNLGNVANNPIGNLSSIKDAITAGILNKIPGVGGNVTFNDITGSTKGIVMNPNAELLYDSPDLRDISMVFKMVPQSDTEAKDIRTIVEAFRIASLPQYGARGRISGDADYQNIGASNFITVPDLCKFTFMVGAKSNTWIAQYKPCGITQVQVNYTPDGTYAAHTDGSPVATELTIKFTETKLIFQQDISKGF